MHGGYQVFLGLAVGKDGHHAVALNRDGKRLHDAALVNTQARQRQVFTKLAGHGRVLVVVDQPAGRNWSRSPARKAPRMGEPGHLTAYAGLAPVTRRSGTSIRGEHPPEGGNKQLKRAFFLAAFASLSPPLSRACYDRKRAQGKHHNAALIRHCVDILHAMLRDRQPYQTRPTDHTLAA